MRSAIAWIATAFVLASFGMAPAMAADWGGIKDMGGGVPVPVPAPAPVPTYDADSDWYIGLAIGGNLLTDADINYTNPNLKVKDGSDIAMSPTFGLTFGRYITPSLRWEVAIDYTPDTDLIDGTVKYNAQGQSGTVYQGQEYGVIRNDTAKLSRTTALFNLLYDIPTGTRFTPYIGGGVGVTWRRLKRSTSEFASCGDPILSPGIPCTGGSFGAPDSASTPSTSESKNQIDLAAAVQAGIATNLTDSIIWDNGWQMLWEGGSISSSAASVAGTNKLVFKDSVLQQFRSGIRIKFD